MIGLVTSRYGDAMTTSGTGMFRRSHSDFSASISVLSRSTVTASSRLEAVTVDLDSTEIEALKSEWERRNIPVPLVVIASPYREVTRPIIDYVKRLRTENPNDVVTVYIPEY